MLTDTLKLKSIESASAQWADTLREEGKRSRTKLDTILEC